MRKKFNAGARVSWSAWNDGETPGTVVPYSWREATEQLLTTDHQPMVPTVAVTMDDRPGAVMFAPVEEVSMWEGPEPVDEDTEKDAPEGESETKEVVTPASLRLHGKWFLVSGKQNMAEVLFEEADLLEKRQQEREKERGRERLVNHLADAYLRGVYADDSEVLLSTFNESSRESVRTGIRTVLKQLAKLDAMDQSALSGFLPEKKGPPPGHSRSEGANRDLPEL